MRQLLLMAAAALLTAASPAPRTEVPIKAATQPNGVRRYAVDLVIDGRPVEAGLDTGSTGLRVMAAALPNAGGRRGPAVHVSFGAGVDLAGPMLDLPVSIAGLAGRAVRVGRVDRVTCVEAMPDCPAEGADPASFRIMSDGVAGQGFVAILGIGLAPGAVANPLSQLGVHRWVVELPRPGEATPGRLVLNPTDAEVARYRQFALAGGNTVAGCVAAARPAFKLCRLATFDTGAPGIRVRGGTPADVLPPGTPAEIGVGDRDGMATVAVTIGRRDQEAAMRLMRAPPRGGPTLSLGIAPYLHWSVLYDADHRRIGLADR